MIALKRVIIETQLTKRFFFFFFLLLLLFLSKKQYSSFGTNIWGERGSSYVVLFLSIGSQKRYLVLKH